MTGSPFFDFDFATGKGRKTARRRSGHSQQAKHAAKLGPGKRWPRCQRRRCKKFMSIKSMTLILGEQGDPGIGWMELVAALASSLAWPIVFVVGLVVFRRELRSMVRKAQVKSIELFGAKIDFGDRVSDLEEATEVAAEFDDGEEVQPYNADVEEPPAAEEPRDQNQVAPIPDDVPRDDIKRTRTNFSPVGMGTAEGKVLAGWLQIERALKDVADTHVSGPSTKPLEILWDLSSAGIISPETVALVEEARNLRNAVVHDQVKDLTFLTAQRYAHSAGMIAARIRSEAASYG